MTFVSDTFHMYMRHVRTTLRIPIWILVTLTQPIIWLALYGQLFKRVVEIPGFAATSYIDFLAPGVVIMTALFGSFWSGMGIIDDLDQGVMDRLLATPAHRASIILARVLHSSTTVVVQSAIILIVGLVLGANLEGGIGGAAMILVLAALLGAAFSAISNGAALIMRREETLIAVVNFFGLPLTFISSAFMASDLMPGWLRTAARFNPVNWAVDAARHASMGNEWSTVMTSSALLLAFVAVTAVFATQAFRYYQRTT